VLSKPVIAIRKFRPNRTKPFDVRMKTDPNLISIISILGAECTGKSALCAQLAASLPAVVVPEYVRLWCERERRTPTQAEQAQIVAGQRAAQTDALADARRRRLNWVLLDSSPLMTAVYSLEYFNDDALLADAIAEQRGFSMTLVTDTDIAWVADGIQRDGPLRRASCQRRLLDLLNSASIPFRLLSGDLERRLSQALRWIPK
jgi:nicotinamide riboside kinase